MSKSLCHDCRHNCTDHKTKSCINYKGIWCNVEYGRVIKKKIKGCKDYERREKCFPQPFPWIKEDDIYCNNCEHFHDCLNKGGLADVTTSDDIVKNGFGRQHYVNKPGYDCPKEEEHE